MDTENDETKVAEQEYNNFASHLSTLRIHQQKVLADYAEQLRVLRIEKIRKHLQYGT